MMNFIFVCVAVLSVATAKYMNQYDNVNVDETLTNCRLFVPYIKCVAEDAKCTKAGLELKKHIPDAIANECAECTEPQKEKTEHVIGLIINKYPALWKKLTRKFDPNNKSTNKHQNLIDKAKKNSQKYQDYPICTF